MNKGGHLGWKTRTLYSRPKLKQLQTIHCVVGREKFASLGYVIVDQAMFEVVSQKDFQQPDTVTDPSLD